MIQPKFNNFYVPVHQCLSHTYLNPVHTYLRTNHNEHTETNIWYFTSIQNLGGAEHRLLRLGAAPFWDWLTDWSEELCARRGRSGGKKELSNSGPRLSCELCWDFGWQVIWILNRSLDLLQPVASAYEKLTGC
ncbi:UNVERIFIED_CONTAM: hypothetical protein K2H54_062532 [Gekko kuhli]